VIIKGPKSKQQAWPAALHLPGIEQPERKGGNRALKQTATEQTGRRSSTRKLAHSPE